MSSSVNSISIRYNLVNEQNIFSNGDILTGRVVVVISKETKIETLIVKARGKAQVHWTEQQGKYIDHYRSKENCLNLDHIILSRKKNKGESNIVLAPGSHVYPFSFRMPRSMPSTFKGEYGSVEYKVEAKLSRSWWLPSKAKSVFTFHSKDDQSVQHLMAPQKGIVTKDFKVFISGNVILHASLEKSGLRQGDESRESDRLLKVLLKVINNTSRNITVTFCVTQKQSFFARGCRKLHMNNVQKVVGKSIPGNSKKKLTEVLTLPPDLPVSVLNCEILKVEYKLRVYLDVPYAKDPEVKLPFVILPASYNFLPTTNSDLLVPSGTFGNTGSNEYKPNPPPAAPGAACSAASAMFPPPLLPCSFLLLNPGVVPPPYAGTAIPPPEIDLLAPPSYSSLSPFPPQSGPGMLPPQAVPGAPPPYIAFCQFPTHTDPGAPPPYTAFGQFSSQSVPGVPPPYCASGDTEPQPDPAADLTEAASRFYPSLSVNGEKVPL
ncbi:arrestin domain-containing protein 3-like [Arapaima gigas]